MDSGHHANSNPGAARSAFRSVFSIIVFFAIVLGLAWGLRTFVFQPYNVPSGSMENTIMTGDYVFSEKISYYFHGVEAGDIVTFEDPEVASRTLIKRVVATEGQTVDLRDGHVYVDGVMADESHVKGSSYPLSVQAKNVYITYPYTVPSGCVWVMGDNRENSQDSRYFGAIPTSSITGRAMLIYWPLDHLGLTSK